MQSITVALIVALAAGYVLWRVGGLLLAKRSAGCGTCSTCPASEAEEKPFVSIDSLTER